MNEVHLECVKGLCLYGTAATVRPSLSPAAQAFYWLCSRSPATDVTSVLLKV